MSQDNRLRCQGRYRYRNREVFELLAIVVVFVEFVNQFASPVDACFSVLDEAVEGH